MTGTKGDAMGDALTDPFAGLPAIFRDCCDPEAVRYDLSRPFVQGDHAYVTDGVVVVRTPIPAAWAESQAVCRTARMPDPAGHWPDYQAQAVGSPGAVPIPDDLPERDRCFECGQPTGRRNQSPVRLAGRLFRAGYLAMLRRHGVESLVLPAKAGGAAGFRIGDVAGYLAEDRP